MMRWLSCSPTARSPATARPTGAALGSCLALALFGLAAPSLSGDSWAFDKGIRQDEFQCGEIRVVRVVDATEDQQWPRFRIEIYAANGVAGTLEGLSFEDLAMSPDCNLFLGISNVGVPRTAVVLFTARGELIKAIDHPQEMELPYCELSVTIDRVWYDEDEPAVEFEYSEAGDLQEITFKSCSGELLGLGHLLSLPGSSEAADDTESSGADAGD